MPDPDQPPDAAATKFTQQLDALRSRLIADYPHIDAVTIEAAVLRGRAKVSDARIPDYRIVLVEKQANTELRRVKRDPSG
jgi:hypothetical protein